MKILHTADIHLLEYDDERWEVLKNLIELGKQHKIDIFTICGDLFDKDFNAENLRPHIRQLFSNTGFKILIIPGNHDKDSYSSGMYFGDDAIILNNTPFEESSDVRILGIPFEPVGGEELLAKIRALTKLLTDDRRNILLCHGELLDAYASNISRTDFGEEGEGRYMPFRLSYFEGLNIDYVLAGHFHTSFDIRQLPNGKFFVYSGSPVSITKRETGRRKVNLFEVGGPPAEYLLDTPHYEEVRVELNPLADKHPVDKVKKSLEDLHPAAKAILTVVGYFNSETAQMSEIDLSNRIQEIATSKCSEKPICEFKDIRRIVEDDLFKAFMQKVELAIRAMMWARR
jgi:DNA repair exonuclease SbcCD nuclease subunit